ncbi:MAG: hypothetical protein OXH52_12675 [Gammaproteobacteria bacterium]|nr:hypothetical protein [Gammaproteobacteria bacterium]
MTPQEALEIRREIRFGRFKDIVTNVAGAGIGLTLAIGIFLVAVYLFDAFSEFDYAEYQREQKLMECLKEAKNDHAAFYCQKNWGPQKEE